MARGDFMKNLTGWQVVALAGILCATLVILVQQGQTVGAIVAAGVVVASALGINVATSFAQNSVNSEKLGQVKDLANGNLAAAREQLEAERATHAAERAALIAQLVESQNRSVQLAAMVPPQNAQEVTGG